METGLEFKAILGYMIDNPDAKKQKHKEHMGEKDDLDKRIITRHHLFLMAKDQGF